MGDSCEFGSYCDTAITHSGIGTEKRSKGIREEGGEGIPSE